jgi:hypothetical protein
VHLCVLIGTCVADKEVLCTVGVGKGKIREIEKN